MTEQTTGRPRAVEGIRPVPAAAGARATERPSWWTLVVVLTGVFMTSLDFFIVNVAMPSTQRDLHASPAVVQFVVAGYGLAVAGLLVPGGRLGDLFGRRAMFVTGLALFTAASAVAGCAPNTTVLITARVVQGSAAALMTPQAMAIMTTVYTGARRTRAFAAYGIVLGAGAVLGQLIGGALIAADIAGSGWRSIYLINVPVGVVALAVTPLVVPRTHVGVRSDLPVGLRGRLAQVDGVGAVLLSTALVAVVLPLVEGRQQGWPLWSWLVLAAALPLFGLFAARQRQRVGRGRPPLLDPALFAARSFKVGTASVAVFLSAMGAFFLLLALYLQQGRGLSALESGLLFTAAGAGYFLTSALSAGVASRIGRHVLTLGAVVMAAGFGAIAAAVTAIGTTGAVAWLVPGLFVAGAGMGFMIAPVSTIVLSGLAPEHAAAGSGALTTAQQAGSAIGVAVVGVVFYDVLGPVPTVAAFPHAFTVSLAVTAGLSLAVAALVQLMPRHGHAAAEDAVRPDEAHDGDAALVEG